MLTTAKSISRPFKLTNQPSTGASLSFLRVSYEHLLESSDVPQPSNRVQGHVRRDGRTTLKRAALNVAVRGNDGAVSPLQVVLTSLDREIS